MSYNEFRRLVIDAYVRRYPIDYGDMTLEEIGKTWGITRETVRQIEARALCKMRHPLRAAELREFIERETESGLAAGCRRVVTTSRDPQARLWLNTRTMTLEW